MHKRFTVQPYGLFSAVLLLFLFYPRAELQATHAMGSDLTYTCLGGNTYEFTLTIYRDCAGVDLTQQQNIEFSSATCGISTFILKADRVSFTELSPLCPAQQPNSSCNGGPLPGVQEHIYKLVVTLPNQCPDWKIAWNLCCRNLAITNSIIGNDTRMYIEMFLNNLNVTCNNSPYFTTAPVPYLCDGEPFSFNNGAVDPDGDSLAFELVMPQDYQLGQTLDVPYAAGFNVNYPMATAPANNFNFDPLSGQFNFTPNGTQQGIVAMLVKEYRNGVLIGSTIRDIQMVVINCANQTPALSPPQNVQGGQLNGNTFSLCAGNTLDFNVTGTDPDAADLLTLATSLAAAIPGATFTTNGTNPITGNFNWPTTVADTGAYFFSMTLRDNGCPIIGQQVAGYNIVVRNGEVLPPQNVFICPTDSNQSIPLSASTPPTGGTYTWSPATGLSGTNGRNVTANVLDSANYTVVYQGGGAFCPIIEPVRIRPEGNLSLTPGPVQLCFGDSVQLQANFSFNGPTVPFVFSWDPPNDLSNPAIANPVASPNQTTNYLVTVTAGNCDFSREILVVVDSAPSLDPLLDTAVCAGNSVQLQAGGQYLNGATFAWSPVNSLSNPNTADPIASPSSTETYTLQASNGCGTDTAAVTVTVYPQINLNIDFTDISCAGANDGTATAVVTGGDGNPVYSWTPAGSGNQPALSNLGPGTYTATVVDGANCQDTAQVTLSQPPALNVNVASVQDNDCFGAADGTVTLSASGGTPPYRYAVDGGTYLSSPTFANLPAGTYSFSVRDDNDCEATTPPVTIDQPPTPVDLSLLNSVNTDCNNPLGEILVGATGGLPPYTYSLDGVNFSPNPDFNTLLPGLYIVYVRDANGCEDTVQADIIEISEPFIAIDSLAHLPCAGDNSGFIQATAFDGTPPYNFVLNGQPQTNTGPTIQLSGLPAGTYTLGLSDGIGCRYGLNFTLTEPDSLAVDAGLIDPPACNAEATARLVAVATGGTAPYSFSLNGSPSGPSSSFDSLLAGLYTLSLLDANGCPASLDTLIPEPDPLVSALAGVEDVACFGESSGSVILGASGGTLPYRYSPDGTHFFIDSTFEFLPAGTYPFYLRDANGCLDSLTATVNEPAPLELSLISLNDALCEDVPNGSIEALGTGGTPPYAFSADGGLNYQPDPLLTALEAGTYNIVLRDANGCLDEDQASLTEPPALIGDVIPTPVVCFGDSNGMAEATVNGGTSPYAYDWNTGATTAIATDLGPGNYTVLVTDGNDCQIALSTEITEPPELVFDSMYVDTLLCFGDSDAGAGVAVSGGMPPYNFSWSNGATDSLVTDLSAGEYVIEVDRKSVV